MIETELVERLEGKGRLRDKEDRAVEVFYSISIRREFHTIRTHDGQSQGAGLHSIEGFIDGMDPVRLYSLMGKTLTLELEDGRLLDCFLKNSDGHLIGTGGFRASS